MMKDLGTCEMFNPTGRSPIAVIPNGDPAEFKIGDEVLVNKQRYRVTRVVDMRKVGMPTPWIGLAIRALEDGR
jgi:hypothetical protein